MVAGSIIKVFSGDHFRDSLSHVKKLHIQDFVSFRDCNSYNTVKKFLNKHLNEAHVYFWFKIVRLRPLRHLSHSNRSVRQLVTLQ